jgi:hypothetical protein
MSNEEFSQEMNKVNVEYQRAQLELLKVEIKFKKEELKLYMKGTKYAGSI